MHLRKKTDQHRDGEAPTLSRRDLLGGTSVLLGTGGALAATQGFEPSSLASNPRMLAEPLKLLVTVVETRTRTTAVVKTPGRRRPFEISLAEEDAVVVGAGCEYQDLLDFQPGTTLLVEVDGKTHPAHPQDQNVDVGDHTVVRRVTPCNIGNAAEAYQIRHLHRGRP